ncbi:MAG: hypothetical protein HOJ79_14210 [Nitrospina sp.]|nr:hypothetical protein [Nitrospina sp.]
MVIQPKHFFSASTLIILLLSLASAPASADDEAIDDAAKEKISNACTTDYEKSKKTFFYIACRNGFNLRKGFSEQEKKEGASISFLSTIGEKTIYNTDFALTWSQREPYTDKKNGAEKFKNRIGKNDFLYYKLQASAEGKLTSAESESEDALKFRGSVLMDLRGIKSGDFFSGQYMTLSLKHESDQNFETRKLTAEFEWTANNRSLAMGKRKDLFSPAIKFRWRPFLGVDTGHTFRRGDSGEKENTVLRLTTRIKGNIFLPMIPKALGLIEDRTFVSFENKTYYLPLENQKDTHNFFRVSLELGLTEYISMGLEHKVGEDAPSFKSINTFGGQFSFRF